MLFSYTTKSVIQIRPAGLKICVSALYGCNVDNNNVGVI